MDIRTSIEQFHLLWCSQLAAQVDRKLWCLKGGCNLRFYFRSIRYSEDIDFDVVTVQTQTLGRNVSKILNSSAFMALLMSRGIELADWSAPKQTGTTQRWKISIKIKGVGTPVPTKIEFSRRAASIQGAEIEFVTREIAQVHKLQPLLMQHYSPITAANQKLEALRGRVETQARDVIDLKFLIDSFPIGDHLRLKSADKDRCTEALLAITHEEFLSQVWPFLLPDYQEHYQQKKVWNDLQEEVLEFVQRIRETP